MHNRGIRKESRTGYEKKNTEEGSFEFQKLATEEKAHANNIDTTILQKLACTKSTTKKPTNMLPHFAF